ncbi:polyadenylate-binding protein-interacting protein 11-like [Canna indica]|uniref:Polyadenylate-binding protein-interacting protein 11-like n=1 Tax=Canna indica TaxID=4628 RepID=A0AAQ3QST8_9LILI|nr:polyadenylate-binding protein-interacting protein 11-like [Canna indica]
MCDDINDDIYRFNSGSKDGSRGLREREREREFGTTNRPVHNPIMAVTETVNGVDLAAFTAPSAGDLGGGEGPDSNKTTDLATVASDSLPALRLHHDPSPAAGFLVKAHQLHRAADPGAAAVAQRPDVAAGDRDGSEREMRDLEELLSKLNPMAEEFVPPSIAGNRQGASDGGGVIAFGGGFYANGFELSQGFEDGSVNGSGGRRKKNGYVPGRRRMNNRTTLAQRDEVIRRTVYVADIDHQVTEEELAALFINCGQVVDCRMCGDPKTVLRFAFIEFTDEDGARAALNLSGTMLGFYPVRVLPSKTAIAPVNPTFLPRSDDEREMCSRTVYCTNIDKKVSQADVRLFFESLCGEVYRLRLLGDYHHSTRIAFVEFVMAESATAALNCSGVVLGSLPIRVSPSKTPVRPRSSRPPMH